jgi:hypothetical protein
MVVFFVPYVMAKDGLATPDASTAQSIDWSAPEIQRYDLSSRVDWNGRQQINGDYLISGNSAHSDVTVTSLPKFKDSTLRISIDGAEGPIKVYGGVPTGANALAVVGTYSHAGSQGGFLAVVDMKGKVQHLVETGAFVPRDVCMAKDGSLWVLGDDMSKESLIWALGNGTARSNAVGQYGLLQQFAQDGRRLGSRLPRSALRPRASDVTRHMIATLVASHIACGQESVGAYIAFGGQEFWYETRNGEPSGRLWEISGRPDLARMSGISLPFAHTVFASFESSDRLALSELILGKNGIAKWVETVTRPPAASPDIPGLKLLGNQADRLVFINGVSQRAPYVPLVAWIRVQRSSVVGEITYEPPNDQTQPISDKVDSKGVQGLVQVAAEGLKQLGRIPAVCNQDPDCVSLSADLTHEVTAWSNANRQGLRTQASDAETARALTGDFIKLNAVMLKAADRVGFTQNQSFERVPPASLATPIECSGSCMTDSADWAHEMGLSYANNMSPDTDGFVQVGCSQDCANMLTMLLAACGVGLAVGLYFKAVVATVILVLACIATSGYMLNYCNKTCDPVCDCQRSSSQLIDPFLQGPRSVRAPGRQSASIALVQT